MDKQKDKPLYVAFSTQKGGAGKTTLTVLMASYLHYVKGYDVAVIDCDFPQYSIHDMRKLARCFGFLRSKYSRNVLPNGGVP